MIDVFRLASPSFETFSGILFFSLFFRRGVTFRRFFLSNFLLFFFFLVRVSFLFYDSSPPVSLFFGLFAGPFSVFFFLFGQKMLRPFSLFTHPGPDALQLPPYFSCFVFFSFPLEELRAPPFPGRSLWVTVVFSSFFPFACLFFGIVPFFPVALFQRAVFYLPFSVPGIVRLSFFWSPLEPPFFLSFEFSLLSLPCTPFSFSFPLCPSGGVSCKNSGNFSEVFLEDFFFKSAGFPPIPIYTFVLFPKAYQELFFPPPGCGDLS